MRKFVFRVFVHFDELSGSVIFFCYDYSRYEDYKLCTVGSMLFLFIPLFFWYDLCIYIYIYYICAYTVKYYELETNINYIFDVNTSAPSTLAYISNLFLVVLLIFCSVIYGASTLYLIFPYF